MCFSNAGLQCCRGLAEYSWRNVACLYRSSLKSHNLSCVLAPRQKWALTWQQWFLFNHATLLLDQRSWKGIVRFHRTHSENSVFTRSIRLLLCSNDFHHFISCQASNRHNLALPIFHNRCQQEYVIHIRMSFPLDVSARVLLSMTRWHQMSMFCVHPVWRPRPQRFWAEFTKVTKSSSVR